MRDTGRIRLAIAKIVPGFEALGRIDENKKEFQVGGRTLHSPRFPTASGKASLHCHTIPDLPGVSSEIRLMTVRSEGQFNTVVYEDYDLYRGQDRRDVILLHPDDLSRFGLRHDQMVRVSNATGELRRIRTRAYSDIRAGNALMYYPECNVLVPRSIDPLSRTPAFKGVLVSISPE